MQFLPNRPPPAAPARRIGHEARNRWVSKHLCRCLGGWFWPARVRVPPKRTAGRIAPAIHRTGLPAGHRTRVSCTGTGASATTIPTALPVWSTRTPALSGYIPPGRFPPRGRPSLWATAARLPSVGHNLQRPGTVRRPLKPRRLSIAYCQANTGCSSSSTGSWRPSRPSQRSCSSTAPVGAWMRSFPNGTCTTGRGLSGMVINRGESARRSWSAPPGRPPPPHRAQVAGRAVRRPR